MKTGINPRIDCVFKKLFGSEGNKALLMDLVNSIMEESGEPKVVELQILNPYNPKTFFQDKMSIVDVKAKSETGEWFILEVQIQMQTYFPKRLVYYWSKIYESQLKEGEKYDLLKKVSLICFTEEDLPVGTKHYYNHFQIATTKEKILFCDDLHIHTVELSKFGSRSDTVETGIEKWAYFLKHGENLEQETLPESLKVPVIEKAVKEMLMFTKDEIEREIYESRQKAIRDYESAMHEKEMIGLKKGIEEGMKKGKIEGIEEGMKKGKIEGIEEGIEEGMKKGKIEGIEEGMKKGKIEGIEVMLEIKFGADGLRCMKIIRKISDIEKLSQIQTSLKKAKNCQEFESVLKESLRGYLTPVEEAFLEFKLTHSWWIELGTLISCTLPRHGGSSDITPRFLGIFENTLCNAVELGYPEESLFLRMDFVVEFIAMLLAESEYRFTISSKALVAPYEKPSFSIGLHEEEPDGIYPVDLLSSLIADEVYGLGSLGKNAVSLYQEEKNVYIASKEVKTTAKTCSGRSLSYIEFRPCNVLAKYLKPFLLCQPGPKEYSRCCELGSSRLYYGDEYDENGNVINEDEEVG